MNKVILMGRLTRDPEVRYSQGESPLAIARYTLAVDRRFNRNGDDATADFINCVAFGKSGEFAERNEDCGYRAYPDRQLYEQGRREGIYDGSCSRGSGICGEQEQQRRRRGFCRRQQLFRRRQACSYGSR